MLIHRVLQEKLTKWTPQKFGKSYTLDCIWNVSRSLLNIPYSVKMAIGNKKYTHLPNNSVRNELKLVPCKKITFHILGIWICQRLEGTCILTKPLREPNVSLFTALPHSEEKNCVKAMSNNKSHAYFLTPGFHAN